MFAGDKIQDSIIDIGDRVSILEREVSLDAGGASEELNGPVHLQVKNTSGVALTKGSPVYATGSVGASGAVEVSPSDADSSSTMPALGLLNQDLSNGQTGDATLLGVITEVNTSAYAVNDELYVSTTAGALTNVRPTGASDLVQKIGRVVRSHATTGEIVVLGAGRTNDVPNGTLANDISGNAATATALETARTIGGVSFDGTANINLPGVNTAGNQDTSGNAATATKWSAATTLSLAGDASGSVVFDGSDTTETLTVTVANDSHTHDTRYYTESESNARYLQLTGGTMTGELQLNARLDVGNGTNSNHEIRIYKADNNVSDHIQFYNGTTRIGEIGCQDTTWLRINQVTAKNIYSPRYFRLDGGISTNNVLSVGQTSLNTARRFYVYGGSLASEIRRETLSGSSGIIVFSGTGGSSRFIFYADGDAAKITGAGDWQGISDDRLKTKLTSLDSDDILAKLMALDPTMYEHTHTVNLVSDGNGEDDLEIVELDEPDPAVVGFMASDFEVQFPELVMTKGTDNIRHLPIGQWDAILTAGLQAAVQRIEDLEARVAALEA